MEHLSEVQMFDAICGSMIKSRPPEHQPPGKGPGLPYDLWPGHFSGYWRAVCLGLPIIKTHQSFLSSSKCVVSWRHHQSWTLYVETKLRTRPHSEGVFQSNNTVAPQRSGLVTTEGHSSALMNQTAAWLPAWLWQVVWQLAPFVRPLRMELKIEPSFEGPHPQCQRDVTEQLGGAGQGSISSVTQDTLNLQRPSAEQLFVCLFLSLVSEIAN